MFDVDEASRLLDKAVDDSKRLFLETDYHYDDVEEDFNVMYPDAAVVPIVEALITDENAAAFLEAVRRKQSDWATCIEESPCSIQRMSFLTVWQYVEDELPSGDELQEIMRRREEGLEQAKQKWIDEGSKHS